MSQARRQTRRKNTTQSNIVSAGLREIVFIFFCFASLYLFVSLATYDPLDPGFSHNPTAPAADQIRNQGGLAGALFADLFFKWFGYFAYLFAYMVGYFGWLIYQGRHHDLLAEPKHLIIPSLGFVLTLTAGCGLAIVHFAAESALLPSHAGGDLGTWIGHGLQNMLSALGATLLLLVLFFTGVTMLTGLSWLKLMDRLGLTTLYYLPILSSYIRYTILPFITQKSRAAWQWLNTKIQQIWQFYREYQRKRRTARAAQEAGDEQLPQQVRNALEDAPPPPEPIVPSPEEAAQAAADLLSDKETAASAQEPVSLLPDLQLLPLTNTSNAPSRAQDQTELQQQVVAALQALGETEAKVVALHPGPVITRVEIQPGKEQLSHVVRLAEQLTEQLQITGARALDANTESLTLEIPNKHPEAIDLGELLQVAAYSDSRSPLSLALGKDINGYPIIVDLARMPHLLISGTQAADINTALHVFLLSLLFKATPQQVRLILVDSRQKVFTPYRELWHLLTPIVAHPDAMLDSFDWCASEMERRYRLMAGVGVRNIDGYNRHIEEIQAPHSEEETPDVCETLPYIVIVLHEIAELNNSEEGREIEELMTRLAQKARAAGIHMILASHQPTVNVITGLMKTNFPTRIALRVDNKTESRHILGQSGAEYLLGAGDMLYLTPGSGIPTRVHGARIDVQTVNKVINQLRKLGKPQYLDLSDLG